MLHPLPGATNPAGSGADAEPAPPVPASMPAVSFPATWAGARERIAGAATRTLRRKLLAAIGLCLLPLVAVLAISLSQRYADRRALELSANREMAETLAVATEAYVRNLDHQLRAVGFALGRLDLTQPAVVEAYLALNRLPYADLDQLAPAAAPSHRAPPTDLALLALVDGDGRVIASDPSGLVGTSLDGALYVERARAVADVAPAVVSDLLPPSREAPPWFAVARPVRRSDGTALGVLVAYVDSGGLGRVLPLDRLERSRGAVLDRRAWLVYDSDHPDLAWPDRDASRVEHVQLALQGRPAVAERFPDPVDGALRLGAAAPIPRLGWVATADRPLAAALAPIDAAARQEGLIFTAVLLFALFVGAVLAHTLTRPLHALQAAVAAIAAGDLARRVPVEGQDEVAVLAQRFNEMAERLETLAAERQAFAAMVAHDLRSPLTVVRGTAQLLQQRLEGDPDAQRRLGIIVRETDRVARLAADLGDAARAAIGGLEVRPRRVELTALVREAVERVQTAAPQPVRVQTPPEPLWIAADPERIAQLLDNLLSNAAKYGGPDQPITVSVRANGGIAVSIADRGRGIPPEELPHVFERFYRARGVRDGQQAGSGLGLYISREIARAHAGALTVESALGVGSRFTLHLPGPQAPDPAASAPLPEAGP